MRATKRDAATPAVTVQGAQTENPTGSDPATTGPPAKPAKSGLAIRSTLTRAFFALAIAAIGLTGCTAADPSEPGVHKGPPLVAFDDCRQALEDMKSGAKPYVGPYGFQPGGPIVNDSAAAKPDGAENRAGAPAADGPGSAAGPGSAEGPEHSGTNNHESEVDEADLVKTDGDRIVTVVDGTLRVIDTETRKQTGQLQLADDATQQAQLADTAQLLLHRDRALVVLRPPMTYPYRAGLEVDAEKPVGPTYRIAGPQILLIDLAGKPEVISRMRIDGEHLDVRAVDGTARLVTRSIPRIPFEPPGAGRSDSEAERKNRITLESSGIDEWAPRYEIDNGGSTIRGKVGCGQIRKAADSSATSLLTVMTLNLHKPLTAQQAVTVAADGATVYGTADSLYVANDQRQVQPLRDQPGQPARDRGPQRPRTQIYKFDTSGTGAPRHTASGTVPGWLLNQYAMSEHKGHLRVATTTLKDFTRPDRDVQSSSAVYVLTERDHQLVRVGSVSGLGKGEQIYSVRFVGPIGYVVTFRQMDPLYTVDLRNPRAPKVTGELKIPGYSAYLHPAGGEQLIGVGQEATAQGALQGTQISLFDVSDSQPRRLARHHVQHSSSEAETDPHAFLYWPKTGLLVIPLVWHGDTAAEPVKPNRGPTDRPVEPRSGALVLRLTGDEFTEVGTISHPDSNPHNPTMVRRSLVVGDTLWTVSQAGVKADNATSLADEAWIPFR